MPYRSYPGKFEGTLHLCEALWGITLDGFTDDQAGDAETTGWYGLLLDVDLDAILASGRNSGISDKDLIADWSEVVRGNRSDVDKHVHAIVFTGSQGFVECEFFNSRAEARKMFDRIAAEIAEEIGDEDSDDDDLSGASVSRQDKQEFRSYLSTLTDRQVQGVFDKEDEAGRREYAELALAEAERRGIRLDD